MKETEVIVEGVERERHQGDGREEGGMEENSWEEAGVEEEAKIFVEGVERERQQGDGREEGGMEDNGWEEAGVEEEAWRKEE